MSKPIIEIKKLNVTYFPGKPNEVKALKNIDLQIYPGEFVIFFGPSGCGKSTLLYSISGLEMNTTGNIIIDNKNIASMDKKELEVFHQHKTGMIFQSFYLINSLTVLQNISLPQVGVNIIKKKREEKAMQLMKRFGINMQAKKLPSELSGGQQQRVAICRALVNEPDILFADEPVGNLDSKSSVEVMRLLKELNNKQKKTVILVTHDPSHLNMAHKIFYIRDGEIIDTKINSNVADAEEKKENKIEEGGKAKISKELEVLSRAYPDIANYLGDLLIPFKAQEIVSEILTGMSSEEIKGIEDKVAGLLSTGAPNYQNVFEYLDKNEKKGGLGLDKRFSKSLSEEIKYFVEEIKELKRQESYAHKEDYSPKRESEQIRNFLLKDFSQEDLTEATIDTMDRAVVNRLENKIDKAEFRKTLDLPVKKGGVGLDARNAKKIAQKLELLMLGKLK